MLPLPGPGQPAIVAASGGTAQADPRDRLEGAAAAVRRLAGSRAPASRPLSSPSRSPANWPASSGPLPAACRRRRAERGHGVITANGGASEPANMLLLGKAGGAAAVRRTLASTICRIADPTLVARPRQLRDASPVMRLQPAHQSLINRRYDGRASGPAQYSPKQSLETKPPIRLPATWKGGHESGIIITPDRRLPLRYLWDRCVRGGWGAQGGFLWR